MARSKASLSPSMPANRSSRTLKSKRCWASAARLVAKTTSRRTSTAHGYPLTSTRRQARNSRLASQPNPIPVTTPPTLPDRTIQSGSAAEVRQRHRTARPGHSARRKSRCQSPGRTNRQRLPAGRPSGRSRTARRVPMASSRAATRSAGLCAPAGRGNRRLQRLQRCLQWTSRHRTSGRMVSRRRRHDTRL